MLSNPTGRFTGRVESYRHYRPGYPSAITDLLRRECSRVRIRLSLTLRPAPTSHRALPRRRFSVTAVEPNDEMRAACANLEPQYPKLTVLVREPPSPPACQPIRRPDPPLPRPCTGSICRTRRRSSLASSNPAGWCAVLYNNRPSGETVSRWLRTPFFSNLASDYSAVKQQHVGRRRLRSFFA